MQVTIPLWMVVTLGTLVAAALLRRPLRILFGAVQEWLRFYLRGVLLLALICGTVLMTCFPSWGLWRDFLPQQGSSAVERGAALTSAAALLALFLFAANHAKSIAVDAAGSEEYLGFNVVKFRALQQSYPLIINSTLFRGILVWLFVEPFLQPVIPTSVQVESFVVASGPITLPTALIAAALWCTCFALAGLVLLLNAFAAIRTSVEQAFSPLWTKRKILGHLRRDTVREVRAWSSRGARQQRQQVGAWGVSNVRVLSSISDPQEQVVYFNATLGNYAVRALLDRYSRRFERLMSRRRRQEAGGSLRDTVRAEKGLAAARACLESLRTIQDEWLVQVLAPLSESSCSQAARDRIIELVLSESQDGENDAIRYCAFGDHNSDIPLSPSEDPHVLLAREVLLNDAHEVANDTTQLRFREFAEADEAKRNLIGSAAFGIRRLTMVLFSGDRLYRASNTSVTELETMVRKLKLLRHGPTRDQALYYLFDVVLRKTATNRPDGETLPQDTFTRLVRPPSRYALPNEGPATAVEIVARSTAFTAVLTRRNEMQPDLRKELLQFLDQGQRTAALLYLLFANKRSHTPLTAKDLEPFHDALDDYRNASSDERERIFTEVSEFLPHSSIGYFVSQPSVEWLLEALERPLTLSTCAEFLEQASKTQITDFGILQFVQWHLLAARRIPTSKSSTKVPTPEQEQRFAWALAQVLEFANEWAAVDPSGAYNLERVFRPFQDPTTADLTEQ